MKAEFTPYDGNAPYLFVSYSHKDTRKIIPILNALHNAGYVICYDKGITGGRKWRDWIADHVSRCQGFLAFLSPASAASPHCEAEINHALDRKKYIIPVYLDRGAELPEGTEMYLHTRQRIDYNDVPEELVKCLGEIDELKSCCWGGNIQNPPQSSPHKWEKPKLVFRISLITVVLVLVLLQIFRWFCQPKWTLEDGVLTISKGTLITGRMPDYPYTSYIEAELIVECSAPWLENKDDIKEVYIMNGISNVCPGMFAGCTNLQKVHIPDSVTSIDEYAFHNCSSLVSVYIPQSVVSVGDYAFNQCNHLEEVIISSAHTSGNFFSYLRHSYIGAYAFNRCYNLTNVEIPKGVTTIEEYAFVECRSLTRIVLPDSITSIGEFAFSSCQSLYDITLPDRITSIREYTFFMCDSLNSITIPDGVTSIGGHAFAHCKSITYISIKDNVSSIGTEAFWGCPLLIKAEVPASLNVDGVFDEKTEITRRNTAK